MNFGKADLPSHSQSLFLSLAAGATQGLKKRLTFCHLIGANSTFIANFASYNF
jgi:hypothetical protein